MDHIYAAVTPSTSAEPNGLSDADTSLLPSSLHDHNFARPPSESPEVTVNSKETRRIRAKKVLQDDEESSSVSSKSTSKRQSSRAKSPTRVSEKAASKPQSTTTKTSKKSSKRAKRSAQRDKSPAVSEEEDGNEDFVPVATMASAPNSPAGMRSILAEHLLSARSRPPGADSISQPDFESLTEEKVVEQTASKSLTPDSGNKEEGNNGATGISPEREYKESAKDDEIILNLDDGRSAEEEQLCDSISLSGPISLQTDATIDGPGSKINKKHEEIERSVEDAVIATMDNNEGVCTNTDTKEKDSSSQLMDDVNVSTVSDNDSNCDHLGSKSSDKATKEVESDQRDARPSVKETSETSQRKNMLSTNPHIINNTSVHSDSGPAVVEEKRPHTVRDQDDKKQDEVGEDALSTVKKPTISVDDISVGCSISEAVKLKKMLAQEKNVTVESGNETSRKRTASDACLDADSSLPGLSLEGTPPSNSALKLILTAGIPTVSASTSTPITSHKKTVKTMSPATKIPKKQGPSEPPFDVTDFLIPLKKHGWKRELVLRGVFDEMKTKNPPGDVYYFTPEGKKLRSKVMIDTYLKEHPSMPLTMDHFTFLKHPISEEPWECVRNAGKSKGRGPSMSPASKSFTKLATATIVQPSQPPRVPKVKIKIGTGLPHNKKKVLETSFSSTASIDSPLPKSGLASYNHSYKSYTVYDDRDEGEIDSTDSGDEDYDPYDEDQKTPKWNKGKKRRRGLSYPPEDECEILIQSMPEPDIIIDRAEEMPHFVKSELRSKAGEVWDEDGEEEEEEMLEGGTPTPPRMMLLPGDIKEEADDSDQEEGGGKGTVHRHRASNNDIGTVHMHRSLPRGMKATARKSTTPRMAVKNNGSSQQQGPDVQLCSNACPGLDGVPPTLSCCICMCLFHHQCVKAPVHLPIYAYKCRRCLTPNTPAKSSSSPNTSLAITPDVNTAGGNTLYAYTSSSTSTTPTTRLVFVRAPFPTPPTPNTPPIPTSFRKPFSVTVPSPGTQPLQFPGASPAVSSQLVKNFGPPPMTVRHGPPPLPLPPPPPQLTPCGALLQNLKRPPPPLKIRPPPKLTAAPGLAAASIAAQQSLLPKPVATTMGNVSSVVVSSLSQPQPLSQMMTISPSGVVSSLSQPPPPTVGNLSSASSQPQPQMMTLPSSLLSQLNLTQPLSLKVNKTQVVVPPSCIITGPTGLKSAFSSSMKVILPPSTFPVPTHGTTNVSSVTSCDSPVDTATTTTTATTSITNAASSTTSAAEPPPVEPPAEPPAELAVSHETVGGGGGGVGLAGDKRQLRRRKCAGVNFGRCAMLKLFGGFDCMLEVFSYLGICDLLRACQVCKTWQQIALQRRLWLRVALKGLHVTSWDKTTSFLSSVGTQSLSLQNICHDKTSDGDWVSSWNRVTSHLCRLSGLRRLELGLVPAAVLHAAAETLTNLEVLRAEHISDFNDEQKWTTKTKLDVGKLARLSRLRELRLRGVNGLALPTFTFSGSLSELANLKHLHTLSLTSLCPLWDNEYHFLGQMTQLQVLEMGDCLNWTAEMYSHVGELENLTRLKLVCGGDIPDNGVGSAIGKLKKLESLELVLFCIPATMESSLSGLPLLRKLAIWPHSNYGLSPALVNAHALTAVASLKQLKTLTWGVVSGTPTSHLIHPRSPSPKDTPADDNDKIPLLKLGISLDPDEEIVSSSIIGVSVKRFTEKLCLALPTTTDIRVFNTQVVGSDVS